MIRKKEIHIVEERLTHVMNEVKNISLRCLQLKFTIRPEQEMKLGKYPAMTIRGGLGYALLNLACTCKTTSHEAHCLYAKLYEEQEGVQREQKYIPYTRPFVIHTGVNYLYTYTDEMTYSFEITLFGEATLHFDLFILAMKQFGETGIGEKSTRFELLQVEVLDSPLNRLIFMNNHFLRVPKPKDLKVIWEEELLPNTLYIEFMTPTRLQVQGKNQINIHLEDVIVNIIRRLRSLVYFHEGETLLYENLELQVLPLLEEVVVHEQKFHYVKYQRFSTRQKQRSFIDGVEGSMQLSQVPPIVAQLLIFGEQLHVGKQTVFGLGAYSIKVL